MTTMKKTSLRQNVASTQRDWYLIDAANMPLGKVAVEAVKRIKGKHRVDFTPHVDGGDYVVIINAEQVKLTGNKEATKMYYRHSGQIGKLKSMNVAELRAKKPAMIIEKAVSGMLSKNKLRPEQMKRLRVVVGADHQYNAQKPETITLSF